MPDADLVELGMTIGLLLILVFVILALIAGNIANQLFASVPSVAGPLGAATALIVFIFLLSRTADVLFG